MKNKPHTKTAQQCLGNFTNIEIFCVLTSGPHILSLEVHPSESVQLKGSSNHCKVLCSYLFCYSIKMPIS